MFDEWLEVEEGENGIKDNVKILSYIYLFLRIFLIVIYMGITIFLIKIL